MSITEAQRIDHKNHIGGSDMAAIMGFDTRYNAYDKWLIKTGRVVEEKKGEWLIAGNKFESGVLSWFSDEMGFGPIQQQDDEHDMERKVGGTPIVVHLDAERTENGEPVEAKTVGLYGPVRAPWGEAGTDEIPEYECIQAHCQMMATDHEICHIPTFIAGGRGFGYFFARRDNKLVDLIREQAIKFWEENVLKDVPPEACVPSLSFIKRIRHIEGEPVKLSEKMVQDWIDAREASTAAEKEKDFHHAGILAALDGIMVGEYKTVVDGKMVKWYVTNYQQTRKAHAVKESTFRVLRPKKKL